MKTVRVPVVCLLALALVAPAWATAFVPCSAKATHHAASEQTINSGHRAPDPAHAQHHEQGTQPMAPECSCCDGCAEVCPFTACSSTAVATAENTRTLRFGDHDVAPLKIGFYPEPRPHPLFRPPIENA